MTHERPSEQTLKAAGVARLFRGSTDVPTSTGRSEFFRSLLRTARVDVADLGKPTLLVAIDVVTRAVVSTCIV